MPLLSYADVRPWATAISAKVRTREMPPWGADPRYGAFRNERRLTDSEIATIVRWIDQGSPKGSDADLPRVPDFAAGWQGGTPDYVIEMPVEIALPAEGQVDVQSLYQPVPFDTDRFAEALEMRPGNAAVVHHGGANIVALPAGAAIVDGKPFGRDGQPLTPNQVRWANYGVGTRGATRLLSFVPGRGYERHRPGVAKRLPAGRYLQWDMHYQVTGRPERDRSRLGLWFNTAPVEHEVFSIITGTALPTSPAQDLAYVIEGQQVEAVPVKVEGGWLRIATFPKIPPYAEDWRIVGITPFTEAVTLYALSPHMHLRGKDMTFVVVYPDGREEIVLSVPRYDFSWQLHYELETPLRIPAGSKLLAIGHYDNSLKNRFNPGPEKDVFWGLQSWDEMYEGWIQFTVDSQNLTSTSAGTCGRAGACGNALDRRARN